MGRRKKTNTVATQQKVAKKGRNVRWLQLVVVSCKWMLRLLFADFCLCFEFFLKVNQPKKDAECFFSLWKSTGGI